MKYFKDAKKETPDVEMTQEGQAALAAAIAKVGPPPSRAKGPPIVPAKASPAPSQPPPLILQEPLSLPILLRTFGLSMTSLQILAMVHKMMMKVMLMFNSNQVQRMRVAFALAYIGLFGILSFR